MTNQSYIISGSLNYLKKCYGARQSVSWSMRTKEEQKLQLPKANIENEIFSDMNSSIVW